MNYAQAERAYRACLVLQPANTGFRQDLARVMLLRRNPAEALAELERIPVGKRKLPYVVLKAWGLVLTDRAGEAKRLVAGLDAADRSNAAAIVFRGPSVSARVPEGTCIAAYV